MPAIFDALPGIEVPVGAISKNLARMWAESAAYGKPAPEADDAKATQLNAVLHLGLNSTKDDALAQFAVVNEFSRRYPCRIVVLCPLHQDVSAMEMRAKIYGECHLGKSKSDKRCVEFVMLSYSRAARPHLENQVSICLSTDLPLFYWAHRFSASGRLADYRYLLSRAKRVLIDSAVAPVDALTYPWPNPAALRDLAYSRLLPVRQSIGQFLAAYSATALADGLKAVTVGHEGTLTAEASVLLAWLNRRLAACGVQADSVRAATAPLPADAGHGLGVRFEYASPQKFFHWSGDIKAGHGFFEADFGGGLTTLSAPAHLLTPASALSEAMFF
jgi:glucose-6-phosphate dehydrogenase assembly protein OpcA